MRVTDNMLEILKSGGSIKFQGWVVTSATKRFPIRSEYKDKMLFAVSPSGDALELSIDKLDITLEKMFQEINSRSHLPESAYRNGIRLDTENRCQSSKCNPAPGGKSRLLFMSAGQMEQVIQIKCKCGFMNTFWKNRIKIDDSGVLRMSLLT